MFKTFKSAAATGAALLLLGASLGTAEALPVAPAAALPATSSVAPVAYLTRSYPGGHHRKARMHRRHSLAPNQHCQTAPSRCR